MSRSLGSRGPSAEGTKVEVQKPEWSSTRSRGLKGPKTSSKYILSPSFWMISGGKGKKRTDCATANRDRQIILDRFFLEIFVSTNQ